MNDLLTAQPGKPYSIGLSLTPHAGYVHLAGELDLASRASLTRLFASLERFTTPIRVDMADVTFIDSVGATALMEGDRRRRGLGLPALSIDARSAVVDHFFDVTGIGGRPYFELAAWDLLRAGTDPTSRMLISRIACLR